MRHIRAKWKCNFLLRLFMGTEVTFSNYLMWHIKNNGNVIGFVAVFLVGDFCQTFQIQIDKSEMGNVVKVRRKVELCWLLSKKFLIKYTLIYEAHKKKIRNGFMATWTSNNNQAEVINAIILKSKIKYSTWQKRLYS